MCMCKNCSVCGLINRSRKVVLYLQRHVMVMEIVLYLQRHVMVTLQLCHCYYIVTISVRVQNRKAYWYQLELVALPSLRLLLQ